MSAADGREREEAARTLDLSLVVTAGAGTGKTSLLIERILHHVLERGTALDRIAAITFTKKAAAELRERLEAALEQALEPREGGSREADRVLERLGGLPRGEIEARCRAALGALDGASVSTLHSFAGDLLRRWHREAGVDVGFEVDEGEASARLFDELWPAYIEETLGPGGDPGRWQGILAKLRLATVEDVAWALAGFRLPLELLADGAAEVQAAHARAVAREMLECVEEARHAIAGKGGVNRNLPGQIDIIERACSKVLASGRPPSRHDLDGLQKSVTLGSQLVLDGKEELEKKLEGVLAAAHAFAECDPDLLPDFARALRPFVDRFREEHTRRGLVSYDGLLALARDLLRNHIGVRREEGRRFDHLLVDEFQDTDPLQYEIVFFLAEDPAVPPAGDAFRARLLPGKLFIVGDAKQSIYRFRGADIAAYERASEAILRERGRPLSLSVNFRSVPGLVEPLNDLFRGLFVPRAESPLSLDPEFAPLAAHRGPGPEESPAIRILTVGKEGLSAAQRRAVEARAVAAWVRGHLDRGHEARRVAILLRQRTGLDAYLRALRDREVPFVTEGGKGFYSRLEVEILAAFLRVLTNPADSVALVSVLRSPALAVPDLELQLHAAAEAEPGARRRPPWSLDAEPDGDSLPELARALELLRAIRRRHSGEPLDRLARAVLEETPLRLAMAASYEGAQRVANLEKAARRIAALSRDGESNAGEILERIEEEEAADVDRGDSPLADEAIDAVRVLTVHAAKGLEWDTVVVPDLAAETGSTRSGALDIACTAAETGPGGPLPAALALRVGGLRTPSHVRHERLENRHRAAEAKRLLYVALTRAKDRLVLVVSPPVKDTDRTWIEPLSGWGYSIQRGAVPDAGPLHGGAVIHERIEEPPEARRRLAAAEAEPGIVAAARAFEDAARRPPPEIRSPSRDTERPAVRRPRAAGAAHGGGAVDRAAAQAAGTAVHLLLEIWDGKDARWLLENAGRAARVASREGADPEAVRARVERIMEQARRTGTLDAIARAGALAREIPVLERGDDGTIWDGTIDVVTGTAEAPEIIDFKTDAEGEDLPIIHGAQLARYAEGVRKAMGLPAPPPARVEWLGG
jgi:ATP-dependent helicase/nuclease subunit A